MLGFVIGFPKAGTSTIHTACRRSGLSSAHWKAKEGACGKLIYERYLQGEDPLWDLRDYDVITQADICRPRENLNFWPNLDFALLRQIRRYHPACVFILNWRDPKKIISSISRWSDLRRRLTEADIIGLPRGFGAEDAHLLTWINSHYAACREFFSSDRHFTEIDIEDPECPQRLSKALNVEIKWWGVSNANISAFHSIREAIRTLGQRTNAP